MSYQSVTIVGNLGKDPSMRYTPSGVAVTNFSVATSRKYTGVDGKAVKETTWWNVSVFNKQAESCSQYLKKGSTVLVEGRTNTDKATGGPRTFTKTDGTTGASYELIANTVRFLSGGKDSDEKPAPQEDDTQEF